MWLGTGLDDDTHLAVVLAAVEAAGDDPDGLWRIGEQPIEEGLLPRPGMPERLRALRETTPSLAGVWSAMRAYYRDVLGDEHSYWET